MKAESFRGRRVLVVGLARSGAASAEYLLRHGAQVLITDLKSEEELSAELSGLRQRGAELVLGSHPPGLTTEIDLVIASPGVPLHAPPLEEARARQIPVWGELELAYRKLRGTLIAITGTKGKSTTASLIAEILKRAGRSVALGGNIGLPLISLVEDSRPGDFYVVEVSSFQLETTQTFRPYVAVLLDVTPDHLDRHPSFEAYVEAKERILSNQEAGDWAVVYAGNPLTVDMASRSRSKKLYFGFEPISDDTPYISVEGPWIVRHENGKTTALVSLESIPLRGRHNVENVMAACAAASLLDMEPDHLALAVSGFVGIPHALEKIGELDGVTFYNDSKATNLASARAALRSFEAGVFLILGGRSKGGDFSELRAEVKRTVTRILALGEAKQQIVEALGDLVPVDPCRSLRQAVDTAFRQAKPGDTVLLSPACASFDMFADYAERGERFRNEVQKLTQRARRGRAPEHGAAAPKPLAKASPLPSGERGRRKKKTRSSRDDEQTGED